MKIRVTTQQLRDRGHAQFVVALGQEALQPLRDAAARIQNGAGLVLGPALGGLASFGGLLWPLILACALCLAATAYVAAKAPPRATTLPAGSLWRMRQFRETYDAPEFLAQLVRETVEVVPWAPCQPAVQAQRRWAAALLLEATARFGWSRNVLLNQIKAGVRAVVGRTMAVELSTSMRSMRRP
ncbi:hypothetical protein J7E62_21340 [Variovorax paradoxus]|nr:hypothetical protein [Variovorax paradoxus]